ncbi:hypothetical protein [Corynebacterium sp. TAE3-ERU12]|nr:hypothetical protein [Corynebacterium sp. TAE3-ERU12]
MTTKKHRFLAGLPSMGRLRIDDPLANPPLIQEAVERELRQSRH